MDNYTILSIVSFVVVLLCLFFSFFLFTVKSENKRSNLILGAMLFLNAVEISSFFYHRFIDMPMALEMIRMYLPIASQPLLFFYVLSLIYDDFEFRKNHLLHLIPYLLSFLILIPRFYGVNTAGKELFYSNYLQNPETKFINISSYIQSIVYTVLIFYILLKARKITLENYSTMAATNIKWLLQLNIFSSVIFILVVYKAVYKYTYETTESLHAVRIMVIVMVLMFTCWLILKALYKPEIFRGIKSDEKPIDSAVKKKQKEQIPTALEAKIQTIEDFMADKKPYLDPNLTVHNLALNVNLPVSELSILINHHIGKHFFDYVNEYRINEAKNILANPPEEKLTILEILYQVGFNSKSSFNSAFKKYTSMTPTQFRKSTDK